MFEGSGWSGVAWENGVRIYMIRATTCCEGGGKSVGKGSKYVP